MREGSPQPMMAMWMSLEDNSACLIWLDRRHTYSYCQPRRCLGKSPLWWGEGGRTMQLPQRKCRMKITRVCFVANNVENLIFFSFSSNISRSPALESVSGDMMSLFVVDMVEESQGERIRFMGTITCGDSPRTANQIARMSIWSKRHKLLQIKLRMFRGG